MAGRVQRRLKRWDDRNQASFDFARQHPEEVERRGVRSMRWGLLTGCVAYLAVGLLLGDFDVFSVVAIVVALMTAWRIYRFPRGARPARHPRQRAPRRKEDWGDSWSQES